ncbi:LysR substrate-binding domain-containing protein [Sphingosinicella microcystinivorans]|uniref:LysR family transcriptional regulator n=1 Tax=Sphingosinicella microcystinivorans TaxID=335406 RepID=A0AAD1D5Q5_SPHMI|nr:LysR substrate-binding domain-containing protein [Sphingosinicella microcystinivorans]RKS91370.1 LysR family transcriptional regulator [Sphingosinicella microcystinivorans]BBE34343.1 LysR family transcriptional regulator [Sphingosinicella microcystinivorans]
MELRHLRSFVTVAEERNFSRAAARLNMSQPPLSRQIQELEVLLGVTLFYRSTRSVELTDAGRALLPKARTILFESHLALDEAKRWAAGHNEKIVLGFMSSIMLSKFHVFLDPLHQTKPAASFKFVQMRSDEQFSALLDERIDAGFVDFGLKMLGERLHANKVIAQHFLREELCAVVPLDHPLAHRKEIDLDELRDEPFAILERHLFPAHHDTVIAECRKAGFAPRILHYGDQIPTVLTYVTAHMGVCIAPRLAETSWGSMLSFVSIRGRPFIDIHLITRETDTRDAVSVLRASVRRYGELE